MKTTKEKAEELVNRYTFMFFESGLRISKPMVKKGALIAVDEIIQTYHSPMDDEQIQEWQEVKQEIKKL